MDDYECDARGLPGPHSCSGVVSAFSVDHFIRLMRRSKASWVSPTSRAHWANVCVLPWNVKKWLLRLLLACWKRSAQQQFSGEYGSLLFLRSRLCCGLGLRPISARKASNRSHFGSYPIPRPPYRANEMFLGLLQRLFISAHARYSGTLSSLDLAMPMQCHTWLPAATSASMLSTSNNGA